MRSLAFFLVIATGVAPAGRAVGAEAPRVVDAYAATLGALNPLLPARLDRSLAARVLIEADRAGIDARLVVALIAVESSWHPAAISSAGAVGLGQLMPATASDLGVDPEDPVANLVGTVRHLAGLLRAYRAYGSQRRYALALGAYNAGRGAVARFGGVPPYAETRAYVRSVLTLWRRLAGVGAEAH